jgi:hypothetical protein
VKEKKAMDYTFIDDDVLMFSISPKLEPKSWLARQCTSPFPELSFSIHTTYTSFPEDDIFGVSDAAAVLVRRPSDPVLKVLPPSVLALNIISLLPGVLSLHTTYALFPEADIAGSTEAPEFVLRFFILSNSVTASN